MVSEGVGARIHRQACMTGGDSRIVGIWRSKNSQLGRLVQFLELHWELRRMCCDQRGLGDVDVVAC